MCKIYKDLKIYLDRLEIIKLGLHDQNIFKCNAQKAYLVGNKVD